MQNESDTQRTLRDALAEYETGYAGQGATLHEAIENAYDNARSSEKRVFHVDHILVWGENPLSGYAVVLHPHG